MIPVIYYAHSMSIYGSEREREELEKLEKFFRNGVIYNPNRPFIEHAKKPMIECLRVVADTTITGVAFSVNHSSFISLGVYAELRCAQKKGKPLYIIRDGVDLYEGGFRLVKKDKKMRWARVCQQLQ
jgi:hypothetical protein